MAGKQADKAELQKLMGLRQEPYVPIVGIVSRLVSHKGLDLVCEVLHDMMELPLQLVILGKGDRKYEEFFQWAAQPVSRPHGRAAGLQRGAVHGHLRRRGPVPDALHAASPAA